ncbi:3-oxoacyl-ACP reductase [Bacillus sp. FJAT-27916]|uniref:SDR family NAD(P)-dependent oxidoreductase n=1 Tax=Bacillus sp. FJAT-27916 TaxID=1679169 RepID=UPI000670C426|nr:SDR family oxidoreductase [Bacillus sp. FJAT-27916]KMY45236.1 3-oxoacyl-ACP reductase [Bacillus sp. FJAT-27916]
MKTIVITGGSKGLGKALAHAFLKKGNHVAVCARGEEGLERLRQETQTFSGELLAVAADVSIEKDVERFISMTEQKFGRIDVLINNAAILGPSPMPLLLDYPNRDFLHVLKVNILNPFLVTKRVLPGMLVQGSGSIINITSEAGGTGYAGWGAYGISKFGIEGLTETWADELAETAIRVNMVDPGSMDTEMHHLAVPERDYELPKPEEILDVFLYLASDDSLLVTGRRFEAQQFDGGAKE